MDTALAYGGGRSERVVGRAIREFGRNVHVATKIPPAAGGWPPAPGTPARLAWPSDHIVRSTEQSLKNLGLDCLDLQQFHTWRDEWLDETEWQETVGRLRSEGKIRAFGISVIDHRPDTALRAVTSGIIDTVQAGEDLRGRRSD